MKYAIQILKKERDLINKCLTEWDRNEYPEARRRQEDKVKELDDAIKSLTIKEVQPKLF